jgi:hypothetical protein
MRYDHNDTATELQLVPVEPETLDNPISMFDIISICREYNKLGYQMQSQVDQLLELGIQDAIKTRVVSAAALPHIKSFLQQVIRNPYFGEAVDQATDCVRLIEDWQDAHPLTMTN